MGIMNAGFRIILVAGFLGLMIIVSALIYFFAFLMLACIATICVACDIWRKDERYPEGVRL